MYNYNVINPVNIHYRKYSDNNSGKKSAGETGQSFSATEKNGSNQRFPNGNKVAIDYTKNRINISQVLQDFRSTIAAINSPDEVREDVESYLGLVGKESLKDEPSREIVLSNLKNAARITDKYIQDSLKKPSRVVQDWVDALFLQKVNLKADPNEVNEDFRVKIPAKTNEHKGGLAELPGDTVDFSQNEETDGQKSVSAEIVDYPTETGANESYIAEYNGAPSEIPQYTASDGYIESAVIEEEIAQAALLEEFQAPEGEFETAAVGTTAEFTPAIEEYKEISAQFVPEEGLYGAKTENEALAKQVLLQGKTGFEEGGNVYDTLKLYDRALELTEGGENANLRSAIYFERGKVFDSCDYADLALIDYHKATQGEDNNLKTQAHIKMGNIYDDYIQIDPAVDQYTRAVSCAEEAENPNGKTRALRYMASMFAGVYDKENTEIFSDLALESAQETNNPSTIAKTYLEVAGNYKYIGDESRALQIYSSLAQDEACKDDYESLAQNYMEASALMDKKGNKKKSYALMLKAKEYQRLARLNRALAEEAGA